jgi:hypothetical protein
MSELKLATKALRALKAVADHRCQDWWQSASDREIRKVREELAATFNGESDEFVRVKVLRNFDAAWSTEMKRRQRSKQTQGGQMKLFAGGA